MPSSNPQAQPPSDPHDPHDAHDPFETLLSLEETLYTSGYALGRSDGAAAGRIEGRIFGLEKGFEKFAALGELHGRAVVWGSRLQSSTSPTSTLASKPSPNPGPDVISVPEPAPGKVDQREEKERPALPPLPSNPRLTSHIPLLHALTDPPTFSLLNTETAVADYDDRFRRAGAKVKVIERLIGENEVSLPSSRSESRSQGANATDGVVENRGKEGDMEVDIAKLALENGAGEKEKPKKKAPVRRGKAMKVLGDGGGRKEDNMEDFMGVGVRRG